MNEVFAALADPNRLRIVEYLCAGVRPVGAIATALNLNQPQASKHLAILRSAKLVNVEKRAQQRVYSVRADTLREMSAWLERYRSAWDARLDELDNLVAEMRAKETSDEHKSR